MTTRSDRIELKLDHVVDQIGQINSTLAAQHVSLKEHMRRSDALEAQMEPVKKHVAMVGGAIKFIGILATLATITAGLVEILKFIQGKL